MVMAFLSSPLDFARDWGNCALNLAFPWPDSTAPEPVPIEQPYCRQCGEPFPSLETYSSTFICNHCSEHDWHFEWARSGYRTDGQVLDAVIGFKYRDESYHYAQLVAWLSETFDRHANDTGWDALVPVPLYHRRRRERGFNQAREIAQGLGKSRKLPVLDCLYRYRETTSQTKLERPARWKNMAGAFQTETEV